MARFSETLMDHFSSPRNQGTIENPDCVGAASTPGQGPRMVLTLKVRDDIVVDAKFKTHGCGVTIAAGSMLTEMMLNRSIAQCLAITAEELGQALGGVPPDKAHSPVLAVTALRRALLGGEN